MIQLPNSRTTRAQQAWGTKGFTLIIIAVVMVVVGLLKMSMLLPLSAHLEQKAANDTRKRRYDARDALFGYAIKCPRQSRGFPRTGRRQAMIFSQIS